MVPKAWSPYTIFMKKPIYTEQELIQALSRNERKAFEYLYDHYSGALYKVVCKIVRDGSLAEDVMQEAFLKIWKNFKTYEPKKGTLFTWMLNITRNTAIDMLRKSDRAPSMGALEADKATGLGVLPPIDTLDLPALLGDLRPERQILVSMVYLQGYTQQEAADRLGIPLGTVKSRMRFAMEELRILFADQ